MSKYKIRIDYMTGDSFGSEDRSEYIEADWRDPNVAKENLKRIQEHYEMYSRLNRRFSKEKVEDICEEYKDKDWAVAGIKSRHEPPISEFSLKLKMNNGNEAQISPFWVGFFEKLHTAEIEEVSDHFDEDEDEWKVDF